MRLIWSLGRTPALGGAGGLPPGFLPVRVVFFLATLYLRFVVGLLQSIALGGARLDLRLGLPDRRQALLAPCQFRGGMLNPSGSGS